MPANASITVNDGKSTPESHVFEPSEVTPSVAGYVNFAQSFPPGRETFRVQKASKSNGKIREITLTLMVPNVSTVNGVSTVLDYRTYIVRCLMPASATEATLDSDTGMLANLVNDSLVKKLVERGEWVW